MLFLTLIACGWNHLPDRGYRTDAPLWDPTSGVATSDGVYFSQPRSGGIVLVPETGDATRVDLGEGRVALLDGVRGTDLVVALVERIECDEDDERELERMAVATDCPSDQRIVRTDVIVLDDGEVVSSVSMDGLQNRLAFSADARFAVAYLDFTDPSLRLRGVVDLTSLVVVDLTSGRTQLVNVGFAVDRVRFQTDLTGQTNGLVVLSRSQVAQLDLASEPWEVDTTFNLTLDPDSVVVPSTVELTPDGAYALITIASRPDLYVLDLVDHAINLVELSGVPAALEVSESADVTVITYTNAAVVDVMDHTFFEIDTVQLDERMNSILDGDGFAVLYATDGLKDAYRLDLATLDLVEYRLENPPIAMQLAPDGAHAVAFTRPEAGSGALVDNHPGMEVLDLLRDDTHPYLLEGSGVGLAFAEGDGRLDALVLQEGARYLYQLDLYTGEGESLELDVAPAAIGSLPDGTFFVSHTSAVGAVSFVTPATGAVVAQHGFATLGALDPIELVEAP